MSVTIVQGDIFLTRAHTIAIGLNASGRLGAIPLHTVLRDRYPVFVSEYHKRGRAGSLTPGSLWIWRAGDFGIVGLVVCEALQGPTRLRHVERAMLNLYKEWEREGIRSLAITRIGTDDEWSGVREVVLHYAAQMALPITLYETYLPGVAAEDSEE
jgi:O-acetyl-ADP-ribose deacetylase (regulator of RNase III)